MAVVVTLVVVVQFVSTCSTVVTDCLSRKQNSGDCLLNRAGAIIR